MPKRGKQRKVEAVDVEAVEVEWEQGAKLSGRRVEQFTFNVSMFKC